MNRLSIPFFLVVLLILVGCGPIEQDIIGEWTVEKAEVTSGVIKDAESSESLSNVVQVNLKMDFRADGTVVYTSGAQRIQGTWKLIRGEFIDIDIDLGYRTYESRYKIAGCYSDKLVLEENFKNGAIVVYHLKAR